jgi:hypothetical protein
MNRSGDDPAELLHEENQHTEPWGGSEHGSPCDKCGEQGSTGHRCWSCLLTSPSSACPACAGKVRWHDLCPVCRGTGVVDGKPRHGVSTFPRLEGLYHYMLVNGADLDHCVIVALEAGGAADVDFDADEGAVLVIPTKIRECVPVDSVLFDRVRERAGQLR